MRTLAVSIALLLVAGAGDGLAGGAAATPVAIPAASFEYAPASPFAGSPIAFTDTSRGGPSLWQWSFGDGATSTLQNPLHTYTQEGSFPVTLSAANSSGSSSATQTIVVRPIDASHDAALFLPGVAHSSGALGSYFRTMLWVVNPGAVPARMIVTYHPAFGEDMAGATVSVAKTLAPGASLLADDVLTVWFGVTGDTHGMLRVHVETGDPLPILAARTYTGDAIHGTYGQFIRGVEIEDLRAAPSVRTLSGLAGNETTRTNLGVANLGAEPLTATVTLRDFRGDVLGTPLLLQVPAFSVVQHGTINLAAGAGDAHVFRAKVEAAGTWFAYASRLDNGTSDPIFIPDTLRETSVQRIDGIAAAPGTNGETFRSALSLLNVQGTAGEVTVSYIPLGSDQSAASRTILLANGESVFYNDVLRGLLGLQSGNGFLRIAGAQTVAWARTYNDTPAGTYGQFIPAFGQAQLVDFTGRAILTGLARAADGAVGGFRSNIGIVNRGSVATGVLVTAHGSVGEALASMTVQVEKTSTSRIDGVLRALGLTGEREGIYLTIQPLTFGAFVYSWASIVDNLTGDAIFVPQIPLADTP